MSCSSVFVVCLALFLVPVESFSSELNSNLTVTSVGSLSEYLRENPEMRVLHSLEKSFEVRSDYSIQTTWQFGRRWEGDHMVALGKGGERFAGPQDVAYGLYYPSNNNPAAMLSMVKVVTWQSLRSPSGAVHITAGGPGNRYISLILNAIDTHHFFYEVTLFGNY